MGNDHERALAGASEGSSTLFYYGKPRVTGYFRPLLTCVIKVADVYLWYKREPVRVQRRHPMVTSGSFVSWILLPVGQYCQ